MNQKIGRVFDRQDKKMYYPGAKANISLLLDGSVISHGVIDITELTELDRFAFTTGYEGESDRIDIYENDIVLAGRCAALVCMSRDGDVTYKYRTKEDIENYEKQWNDAANKPLGPDECIEEYDPTSTWHNCRQGDFLNIKKVLGNKHENPEMLELISENPQPFPEENKVEFIDFSLSESDKIKMIDVVRDELYMDLIRQELESYLSMGLEIDPAEFEVLCKRRGFNVNEKNFMIKALKYSINKIGDQLEYDTTHESIKTPI